MYVYLYNLEWIKFKIRFRDRYFQEFRDNLTPKINIVSYWFKTDVISLQFHGRHKTHRLTGGSSPSRLYWIEIHNNITFQGVISSFEVTLD